jgi:predicted metal-dependent hydrolase
MPTLQIGATEIQYRVRESSAAKSKRVVVTPGDVEVVVPYGESSATIAAFVHEKRRWIYERREEMLERESAQPMPKTMASGAKVMYRGRWLRLILEQSEGEQIEVACRQGFYVRVPRSLAEDARDNGIRLALETWMRAQVQSDVETYVRRYAPRLGVQPKAIRIGAQQRMWGSCTPEGVIHLHWHLCFAPKPVLEYAVVHELCHLRHRDHSEAFWRLVAAVIPGYEKAKRWLDRQPGWTMG